VGGILALKQVPDNLAWVFDRSSVKEKERGGDERKNGARRERPKKMLACLACFERQGKAVVDSSLVLSRTRVHQRMDMQ